METIIKEQISKIEIEIKRAISFENYTYAQELYFNDLLPLIKFINKKK